MLLLSLGFAPPGMAAPAAPAPTAAPVAGDPATPVQGLDDALLASMHSGASTPASGRYRLLEPVVRQAFDLPLMTRLSVGPEWTTLPPDQQRAAVAALTRYVIASYAHNFRDYAGEKFQVDNVANRGNDKIVQTRLVSTKDTTNITYRMRELDGGWKIIDVYYDGISQLTLQRTDFGAAMAKGGVAALVSHLNGLSDGLMK